MDMLLLAKKMAKLTESYVFLSFLFIVACYQVFIGSNYIVRTRRVLSPLKVLRKPILAHVASEVNTRKPWCFREPLAEGKRFNSQKYINCFQKPCESLK